MAVKLDDKPDKGVYDDNQPSWQTNLKPDDLEESFGKDTATDENLPPGHPSRSDKAAKSLDGDQLQDKEDSSAEGSDSSPFNFKTEVAGSVGEKLKSKVKSRFKLSGRNAAIGVGVGAGGGALVLLGIIALMILLSSLKVINFGQVLATAGYIRFNGILEERTTQDIFDASVVSGDGSVTAPKGSLVDRILMRNVDEQIGALGREGKLKFILEDDKMTGVKIGDQRIKIDDIAQEKFSKTYADASPREKLTIRGEFVDRIQTNVGESLALEPRYVRSNVFGIIADKTGFKFSRWRQAGREFFGKTPVEAGIQDQLDSTQEVSADKSITTGVEEIDGTAKQIKNADRLKSYLEKNGGEFSSADFIAGIEDDVAKASGVQTLAKDVSMGVIIMSLACMANQAFAHVNEAQNNNEIEAVRIGLQLIAAKDQIMRGGVTSLAVGAAARQVDGGDQAPAYQYATNRPITNNNVDDPRITPKYDPQLANTIATVTSPSKMGVAGQIASKFPGGDAALSKLDAGFCDKVLSPGGAATIAGIDVLAQAVVAFFDAGGNVALEQGAGRVAAQIFIEELATATYNTARDVITAKSFAILAGTAIYGIGLKFAANSLASTDFSGTETGPGYVQRAFVGTNVLQSRQVRTLYGKPITTADAGGSDKHYAALNQRDWQQKDMFARYFSPDNPYSLTGSVAMAMPSSFASALTSLQSAFSHLGSIFQPLAFGSLVQGLVPGSQQAHAAAANYDPYNGVQQWGFSADEMDKIRNDKTYSIGENEKRMTPSEIATMDASIGPCFDPARTQFEVEHDPACAADKLSTEEAFRYRLYKLDSQIANTSQEDLTKVTSGPTPGGATAPTSSGTYGWPMTAQSTITQCFTWNAGTHTGHPGLDISGTDGTPIFAIADGTVDKVGPVDGYGYNFVSITHTNGFGSSYGHMSSATVQVGQAVKKGDQIGTQGNQDQRGVSTGSHLHLNLFPGKYGGSDTPNIDPLGNGLSIPAGVNNSPHNCQ